MERAEKRTENWREREKERETDREREKSKGSKYGSFEFRPGRRIGSASETQHMKRGNLADFSICHRGGLHKWNYHPCAPPSTPLSIVFQESSLPSSVCLSFQPFTSPPVFSTFKITVVSRTPVSPALPSVTPSPPLHMLICFSISLPLSQRFFPLSLSRTHSSPQLCWCGNEVL